MKVRIVGLCAGLLMCAASRVRADTITITGGFVNVAFPSGFANANLIGSDTNIVFVAPGVGNGSLAFNDGEVGRIGQLIFFSTQALTDRPPELVGGTLFPASDYITGSLNLLLSPFHAPATDASTATFVTPSTLSGSVVVHDPNGAILLMAPLSGDGEASIITRVIVHGPITQFSVQTISSDFAETPSATPEPASMLLFGTGLVGLLARRRI